MTKTINRTMALFCVAAALTISSQPVAGLATGYVNW